MKSKEEFKVGDTIKFKHEYPPRFEVRKNNSNN